MLINCARAKVVSTPFFHSTAANLFPKHFCGLVLDWMESAAPWKLQVASFYEQWELHLDCSNVPPHLSALYSSSTISAFLSTMLAPLSSNQLTLSEITAHKLVSGQTIKVHNDYIGGEETHRLLVQLNRGWADEQGGLLMLFSSPSPDDVARVVRPLSGSAFAFPISPNSFHAVSTIKYGERYTLVYSFRNATAVA